MSCSPVEDEQGVIDNVFEIDGKIYLVFEENKARKMLADLENYKISEEQIKILNGILVIKNSIIDDQSLIINMVQKDREISLDMLKAVNKSKSWYEESSVIYFGAFLTSSLLFGYWSYTNSQER
jgi:hypothetical protein